MVYYINNYYKEDMKLNRVPIISLASNNKIKYIHYLLNTNKINFTNISFGFTKTKGYSKSFKYGNDMVYFPCVNFSNKNNYNIISILFTQIYLVFFIMKNVKQKDTIIMYHHPWISPIFNLVKKIKKFTLLLEVEEICFKDTSKNKIKSFFYTIFEKNIIKLSDSFIVVNDFVKEYVENIKLDVNTENIIVCYGNYSLVNQFTNLGRSNKDKNDETVSILYSGSIDKVRGAFEVIELIKTLNDDGYTIYITGYGRDNDIKKFKYKIDELDLKKNKILFLGQLPEEEYLKLLNRVDICLSCQNDKEIFAKYSFPSKIINYLAFDKIVVTSNMESIKRSKVKDCVYYYNSDDLTSLAGIISDIKNKKQIVLGKEDNYNKIFKLNTETIGLFSKLIKGDNDEFC